MSYEVYIDVVHHPKHCDEWEQKEQTAYKLTDTGDPLEMVVYALREFADELEKKRAALADLEESANPDG